MEVFSKKLEGMGGLLNQPFTLTLHNDIGCNMYIEEMQPIMKDYLKNIYENMQGENCAKPLRITQEKPGGFDIFVNDCQCSECVHLPRCLAMEEICIIESHLLFSACFQFLTCSFSFRLYEGFPASEKIKHSSAQLAFIQNST